MEKNTDWVEGQVLPESEIEYHSWPIRSSGGQHTGAMSAGVLVVHTQSGIAVFANHERSQLANKKYARERIERVVDEYWADYKGHMVGITKLSEKLLEDKKRLKMALARALDLAAKGTQSLAEAARDNDEISELRKLCL